MTFNNFSSQTNDLFGKTIGCESGVCPSRLFNLYFYYANQRTRPIRMGSFLGPQKGPFQGLSGVPDDSQDHLQAFSECKGNENPGGGARLGTGQRRPSEARGGRLCSRLFGGKPENGGISPHSGKPGRKSALRPGRCV